MRQVDWRWGSRRVPVMTQTKDGNDAPALMKPSYSVERNCVIKQTVMGYCV